jgi:hypothetical protein
MGIAGDQVEYRRRAERMAIAGCCLAGKLTSHRFGYDAVGKKLEDVKDVKQVEDRRELSGARGERWLQEKRRF